MSRRLARVRTADDLAPPLSRVIAAAGSPLAGARRRHEAAALLELGRIARLAVPVGGVLAPVDNELIASIDIVARRHLGQRAADRAFRNALRQVKAFRTRDAIDTAHAEVLARTSVAYYYAGMAWGLEFVDVGNRT